MATFYAYFTGKTSSTGEYSQNRGPTITWTFQKITDAKGKTLSAATSIPTWATHVSSNIKLSYTILSDGSAWVISVPKETVPRVGWFGNYTGSTIVSFGQKATWFNWFKNKTSGAFRIYADNDAYDEDSPGLIAITSSYVTIVIAYTDHYDASTGELSVTSLDLDPANPQSVYMTITNNCEEEYRNKVYHVIDWRIPNAAFGNYAYSQRVDETTEQVFSSASYSPPTSFLKDYMRSMDSVVMNVTLQTMLSSDNTQIGNAQSFTLTLKASETLKPTFGTDGAEGLFYYRFHDASLEYLLSHNNVFEEDIGLVQSHDGVSILVDNAAGIEGSSVTDFVYTISGKTYTQHVGDPNFPTVVERQTYVNAIRTGTEGTYANVYKIPLVTSSYDMTVNCYVIDSRGHKSISQTLKIPVTAYSIPSITEASSIRCDAEGTALETGLYARASATAYYSRLTVVERDSQGNIVYSGETDDEGNPIPNYRNLNTLEITVAFGEPTYDPGRVDEDGNPIPVWTWISPEDDVIGTPISPTSGSKVVGDGVATHVTGIRFLANDYFTSQLEIKDQPMEIVFTTSSEYAIFFREGGTGVSFGQALSANEDNRFVVSSSWAMLHGGYYIPSVVISTTAPNFVPPSNSSMLWLKPDDTDTVGNWMGCKVYIYNP